MRKHCEIMVIVSSKVDQLMQENKNQNQVCTSESSDFGFQSNIEIVNLPWM